MTEQKFPRVGVGAFILNKNNEVLLMRRKKSPEAGFWSIPDGKVEFQESIEEALKREVKEELGVEIAIIALLGVTNHIILEENAHWISPVFLTEIIQGTPENLELEKHSEMKWFSIENFPENLAIPAKKAVDFYLKR